MSKRKSKASKHEDYDYNDGFLVSDDEEEYIPKSTDSSMVRKYRKKIIDEEVTITKLLELKLPETDMLWFVEYLDILDNTQSRTEERYLMKKRIQNKYTECYKFVTQQEGE